MKAGTGKAPIIYTGKYFWQDNVKSTAFGTSPLWIAAYGPTCPNLPVPWSIWRFFQYSDKGHVAGISGNVDVDRFNGSLAELEAFASTGGGGGGGGTTSPPPPDPSTQCYSHTLGREVAKDTCVQSRADKLWYQCDGNNHWIDRATDPSACSSVHPL